NSTLEWVTQPKPAVLLLRFRLNESHFPMPNAQCPECSNFRTKSLPYLRAEYVPLWGKININQGKNI
ncbi:hypothetical protein, partial [Nostoc sp.]|uniref:hypothetical protein n=1 Tax=Nostoc sp. TaxID=1180 RepID=UPI002FFC68BC